MTRINKLLKPVVLALIFFSAASTTVQAQGNGDPYLVCENCWSDPPKAVVPERPNPTPKPAATPIPTESAKDGKKLRGQFIVLVDHARELIPTIRRVIEKPVLGILQRISWVIASFILLISFVRVLKENNGATSDFYYWITRGVFWLHLLVIGPFIVTGLLIIGNLLTIPLDGVGNSVRVSFDERYEEFMEGHFVIRDSKNIWVPPMADGQPGLLGILYDKEAKVGDIDKALDMSSWEMPKLFALLNFTRGLMEFADFWLIIGGGIILIGLRLGISPAIALGIDQKLAHQMTYPYAWGTVAFTLVFPLFRDILRMVGYLIGSLGLAMYDGKAMYWMDERTGAIISNNGYQPTITIFIAAFLMLISALTMFMTPVLAYRYVKGQQFEGLSSVAGGWMASLLGTGVEAYGLKLGAAIQKQGEQTQIQGGYQSEMTRAAGSLEAGNLSARARQISGTANIQGGLTAALANIQGNATTQRMIAAAGAQFGKSQTVAGVTLSQREIGIRKDQAIGDTTINRQETANRIATDAFADKQQLYGTSSLGPLGAPMSNRSIGNRTRGHNEINNTYPAQHMALEQGTATKLQESQGAYGQEMGAAYDQQLSATVEGVNAGAGIAAGGAARGAAISAGGINKAYALEVKANKSIYEASTDAANITRTSSLEAADMRALNHVVTSFFRDLARRADDGLKPRY